MNILRVLGLLVAVFVLASCAKPPVNRPELALEQVSWWHAGFKADDLEFQGLADAGRQSLEYYRRLSADASFTFGPARVTAGDMILTLQNFLLIIENTSLTMEQKVEQIKDRFDLYRSVGSNGRGRTLFTGYYEPMLSCRRTADDEYTFPLYKRPDDIVEIDLSLFGENFGKDRLLGRLSGKKVIPYFTRQEIDQQKLLAGKGLEVLWCADPVDVYTLQVQGSGKADLGNGEIIGILYDGQNGRPYRGIGRYLVENGAIPREKMSMPAIREYLKANPEKLFEILHQNPSYVFFKVENKPAVGNIGVPLTSRRSIATDYRLFPKGALALVTTEKPVIAGDGAIVAWTQFTRFVMNQDTGGAIRGPGRVDLFWGQGRDAELSAGYMQQEGKLYFLLLKDR